MEDIKKWGDPSNGGDDFEMGGGGGGDTLLQTMKTTWIQVNELKTKVANPISK